MQHIGKYVNKFAYAIAVFAASTVHFRPKMEEAFPTNTVTKQQLEVAKMHPESLKAMRKD